MFQSGIWTLRIVAVTGLLALTVDSVSAGPLRGGRGMRGDRWGNVNGGFYGGPIIVVGSDGAPYYSYGGPAYYPGDTIPLGATNGRQSNYYAPINDMTATIDVRVPPNALVFFDDEPTRQSGGLRTFTSPPLAGDSTYRYTVHAKWDDNGKTVEQTRKVEVRAGRRTVVDFLRPETNSEEKAIKPKLEDK